MASKLYNPNKSNLYAIVSLIGLLIILWQCSPSKRKEIKVGGDQLFTLPNTTSASGSCSICIKGELEHDAMIKISCPDESQCFSKKIKLKAGKIDTIVGSSNHYSDEVLIYFENNYNRKGYLYFDVNCKSKKGCSLFEIIFDKLIE